jgi:hypothetical protein
MANPDHSWVHEPTVALEQSNLHGSAYDWCNKPAREIEFEII